VVKLTYAFK